MATKKNTNSDTLNRLEKISKQMDALTIRLNVTINLLLDIVLSNEKLDEPRGVTEKLEWLDSSMRFPLRPSEAADILGRRAGDISSRRKEIANAKKQGRKIRNTKVIAKRSSSKDIIVLNNDSNESQNGG